MLRKLLPALLCVMALVGGAGAQDAGAQKESEKDRAVREEQEAFAQYCVLIDTIDQISRNYVDQVSREELIEAAIEGVIKKLDPYSDYIPQRDIDGFRKNIDSKFGGIGVQIHERNGRVYVVAPLFGTPAYDAGIFSGDEILEVDGQPVVKRSVDDVTAMMKGEIGTEVSLKLRRKGTKEPLSFDVVRDIITMETVMGYERNADDSWNFWLDAENGLAYIHISSFGQNTARELQAVLANLQTPRENSVESPLRGLILDLRFNPGGLFPIAIEICDMFVDDGVIVSTKGRNTKDRSWSASREKTLCDVPMVVLVNHYSASASEVVSACLQDHDRAIIVGQRTWGKGSVQNVMELEDGNSALKLTTAGYIRPNGKNIHRAPDAPESEEWGVSPREEHDVPMADELLMRLIEDQRQRQELRTHRTENRPRPKGFQDPQLLVALDVLSDVLDLELDAARPAVESSVNRRFRRW